MIDEMFDRHYQAGRERMNGDLASALAAFARAAFQSFKVLNRIEYQAPWAARTRRARCN